MTKLIKHSYFFRAMRLLTLFIFGGFFSLSAATYSQTVSLQANGMPLTEVFKKIYQQTGYQVAAKEELLKNQRVDVTARKMPLNDFLGHVLTKKGLTYELVDNNIFVKAATSTSRPVHQPREEAETTLQRADAGAGGRVVDGSGNPLQEAPSRIQDATGDWTGIQGKTNQDGYAAFNDVPDDALPAI